MLEVSLRASQQRSSGRKIFPKEEKENRKERNRSATIQKLRGKRKRKIIGVRCLVHYTQQWKMREKGTIRRYFYHKNE